MDYLIKLKLAKVFTRLSILGFALLVIGTFLGRHFPNSPSSEYLIIFDIFFIILFAWLAFIMNRDRRNFLKTNGLKIQTKVKYISAIYDPIGRRSKAELINFQIVSEGKNISGSELKQYKSSVMDFTPDINIGNDTFIDVYVNPKDNNDYWVDISRVPIKKVGTYVEMKVDWNSPALKALQVINYVSYDGVNYEKVNPNTIG